MADQSVRNLIHLEGSASSARVLNLLRVYRLRRSDPSYAEHPFFQHDVLNRCLILKHRLRGHERELFVDARQTATKIIVPIDGRDLRLGGRSVFVGQLNYDLIMQSVFGDTWLSDRRDHCVLDLIDQLPSFDPFLLREHLRRHDYHPARCYFDISEADIGRMFRFVQHEVHKLIVLSFRDTGTPADEQTGSRLVKKILSDAVDAETEPLRLTLRLEKREYQEGVFCWKGFLYYKWTLHEALPSVTSVLEAIAKLKPHGPQDADTRAQLAKSRENLRASILNALQRARGSLRVYDEAFAGLVDGKPQGFRDFLLSAPSMFCDLGEQLGAVSHIVSFWNFRFPKARAPIVSVSELRDIFQDFEESLGSAQGEAVRAAG
jgi:hypothetical protein